MISAANLALIIKIDTVPQKWYDIDMETGQVLKAPQIARLLRKVVFEERELVRAARRFAKSYNIQLADIVIMLRQQGGKCGICLRARVLSPDFVGGELAGFLCRSCLIGLNRLGRSEDVLKAAIKYTERDES